MNQSLYTPKVSLENLSYDVSIPKCFLGQSYRATFVYRRIFCKVDLADTVCHYIRTICTSEAKVIVFLL